MRNIREFPEFVRALAVESEFAMADKRLAENFGSTRTAMVTEFRALLVAAALSAAACSCEHPANPPGTSTVVPTGDRVAAPKHYAEPYEIQIEGREFQWNIRYSGPDGQFGTADDVLAVRHPHIPANTAARLIFTSGDYVYLFAIPQLQLREMAIPDRTYEILLEPLAAGTYEFRGSQMCGFTHPNLSGSLVVDSPRDFEAWLKTLPRTP